MAGRQGRQPLGVEAGDQVRDGVAGAAADGTGGLLIVVARGDGQEELGPGTSTAGAACERQMRSNSRRSVSVNSRSGSFLRRDMAASVG